jgi:hypothetical protein
MKIGELTSFGHNVADSLSSGLCFMIGHYPVDIYEEAASSPEGHITVNFMSGSPVSASLNQAIALFSKAMPVLCKKHGIHESEIKTLTVRFGTDLVAGRHFLVTVDASDGRRSVDQYVGVPGKRFGPSRKHGNIA